MRGYVVFEHIDQTSEGFGSLARNNLYPLLHIAIACDLKPVLHSDMYKFNTARDYGTLHVNEFLDLADETQLPSSPDQAREVIVNTWSGAFSPCGNADLVAETILNNYLDHFESDDNDRVLVVKLEGALRSRDPSPAVYRFLQERSSRWKTPSSSPSRTPAAASLKIVAHVRVPEDFTPDFWKFDNHISRLIHGLETLSNHGLKTDECDIQIYTEEMLSSEHENMLKSKFPNVQVHRGNAETLLEDIKAMACSDIFIPSSSFLSAFVGYLTHGVVLITDPSRREYFQKHRELGVAIIELSDLDAQMGKIQAGELGSVSSLSLECDKSLFTYRHTL
jgi:hypothetical protein